MRPPWMPPAAEGDRFAAYAPVENTDGWSVAVTAPKTDYLADTYFGIFLNIAVIVSGRRPIWTPARCSAC